MRSRSRPEFVERLDRHPSELKTAATSIAPRSRPKIINNLPKNAACAAYDQELLPRCHTPHNSWSAAWWLAAIEEN